MTTYFRGLMHQAGSSRHRLGARGRNASPLLVPFASALVRIRTCPQYLALLSTVNVKVTCVIDDL